MKKEKINSAAFWDSFAHRYDRFMHSCGKEYGVILSKISDAVNAGDDVLELGCGTGEISLYIAKSVKRVRGIDISSEMVRIARNKCKVRNTFNCSFDQGDIAHFKSDKKYDQVVVCNVLHLVPDAAAALHAVRLSLKKGGRVICPTYCHGEHFLSRFFSRLMSLSGFKAHNKWSSGSFIKTIEDNGFVIVKTRKIGFVMPLLYVEALSS